MYCTQKDVNVFWSLLKEDAVKTTVLVAVLKISVKIIEAKDLNMIAAGQYLYQMYRNVYVIVDVLCQAKLCPLQACLSALK